MRWLIVVAACGSSSAPSFDESAYVYELVIAPIGNTVPLYAAREDEVEYDLRANGQCIGRGVDGEPFRPRKSPHPAGRAGAPPPGLGVTAWLAPVDQIAVGVIVRSAGKELVRGCKAALLQRGQQAVVEVELK